MLYRFISFIAAAACFYAYNAHSAEIENKHFTFSNIAKKRLQFTRDAELGNAQEYCVRELKKNTQAKAIWAITVSHLEKSEESYSFQCDVSYFADEPSLKKSMYYTIENQTDYRPFQIQGSSEKIIAKVRRLAYLPYIQVTLENIEPDQKLTLPEYGIVDRIQTLGAPGKTLNQKLGFAIQLIGSSSNEPKETELELESGKMSLRFVTREQKTRTYAISPMRDTLNFPKNFKWAVATSAHQIEGGKVSNDWSNFEKIPGNIFGDEKSENGPDHWNRLHSDTELLKKMGVNQYRLSIEWARIEPSQGHWDANAIAHYKEEIQLLKKNGIEPVITLWHSTFPQWVAEKGGWEWEGIPEAFTKFSVKVKQQIAPHADKWVTLNEPFVYLLGSYVKGVVPPARKGGLDNVRKPLSGMLKAHAAAYHALHKLDSKVKIGIAHRIDMFTAFSGLIDGWTAKMAQEVFNWTIPRAIQTGVLKISVPVLANFEEPIPGLKGTQDYFGINYYTRYALETSLLPFDVKDHPIQGTEEVTDMGWEIYPEGLYILLSQIDSEFGHMPVMILENGIADQSDRLREKYIRRHLVYLHHAIEKGIPVQNYAYWSLYDNFEWDQGFSIRVGLYSVDYATKERIPRASAHFFWKIIKQNGVEFPNLSNFRINGNLARVGSIRNAVDKVEHTYAWLELDPSRPGDRFGLTLGSIFGMSRHRGLFYGDAIEESKASYFSVGGRLGSFLKLGRALSLESKFETVVVPPSPDLTLFQGAASLKYLF